MFFKKRFDESELLAFHLTQAVLRGFATEVREGSLVTLLALETRQKELLATGSTLVFSGLFQIDDQTVSFSSEFGISWLVKRKKGDETNQDMEHLPFWVSFNLPGTGHSAKRALMDARRASCREEWVVRPLYTWEEFVRAIADRLKR